MKTSIPKINQLFKNPTVLILGAGASRDYGFPLWSNLKENLLQIFSDQDVPEISNHESSQWWTDKLMNMSASETVDSIAPEAPDEYYDRFRLAIALIVLKYEALDKGNRGWVEYYAEKYAQMLLSLNEKDKINQAVQNTTVITLNYDRSFNVRFGRIVVEKFKEGLGGFGRNYSKFYQEIFEAYLYMVLHPHGCIGSTGDKHVNINDSTYQGSGAHLKINYGDYKAVLKLFREQGFVPNVTSIDDIRGANNGCYDVVNRKMHAKNALCIGLSSIGVKNSLLKFDAVENVYYSGEECVFDNFIPLNLRADQIVESL